MRPIKKNIKINTIMTLLNNFNASRTELGVASGAPALSQASVLTLLLYILGPDSFTLSMRATIPSGQPALGDLCNFTSSFSP